MSKAKSIEQKRPRPINQIKLVGRTFLVEMQMGRACPVVEITMNEFNRMMDYLCDTDNMSQSVLDKMSEICRKNLRKGKLARRLRPETIEQVKAGYCNFYGRDWESICSSSRKAAYIETRMLVCGHLRYLKYTDAEISTFFVPRDRTTIMSAIKRHNDLLDVDKTFAHNRTLLASSMEKWMLDTYQPNEEADTVDELKLAE